jgi:hypothetical protein
MYEAWLLNLELRKFEIIHYAIIERQVSTSKLVRHFFKNFFKH